MAEKTGGDMEFRDYLLLTRRRWRLILTCTLLTTLAAVGLTMQMTPKYTAGIKMFVSSGGTLDPSVVYQGGTFSEQRAKSYADLLRSRHIAEAVIADLGLRISPGQLQAEVRSDVVPDTVMLKASVTDASPLRAQQIANALGHRLSLVVDELERTTMNGPPPPVKVTVVDPADLPGGPSSPRPLLNLLSGLALGALLGFGLAVLRELLDRSIKSEEQLGELTGAPGLGVVCHDPKAPKRPLVVHLEAHAPRSEAFRKLRTSLQFVDAGAPARRIVITSCRQSEGKSSTASNLAITLAQADRRVIVVDADLRRPRLSEYLGIEGAAGLTDVLIGRADVDTVLQPWGDLPMSVLPSGPIPPNPSELLGSPKMEAVLAELSLRADIVLFDVPPLLPVTDAVILGRLCDGVLLIAKYGSTTQDQIRRATATLKDVNARLLGTLLNMMPTKGPDSYHGYGYGYGYGNGTGRQHRARLRSLVSEPTA